MKLENLPDYVKPYKTKGYDIRVVNGVYRLLKVTSKRVKGKKYPTLVQEYIGIITEDKGLIYKKERVEEINSFVEYGLSNFIFNNFCRSLMRSIFNGGSNVSFIKLSIIYFIYKSIDERIINLSYLTKDDNLIISLSHSTSIDRIKKLSSKIEKLFKELIPNNEDLIFVIQSLRQIMVPFENKNPNIIYPNDLKEVLTKYGVKYEK